jgi:Nucleotidyl transferase AbiEii toxin, Type IV TA system
VSTIEPARALVDVCRTLRQECRGFALVGGLAVSLRTEVRFTSDADLVVAVADDKDAEALVFAMRQAGYEPFKIVEHELQHRLATARLESGEGNVVDLLFASSGIEPEIVERAENLELPEVGTIAVARAEELLAMKLLSMTPKRLQDRIDAQNLIRFHPDLDLEAVRDNLRLITARGYHRDRDLAARLDEVLAEIRE